jgi:hypothetical protein
MDCLNMPHGKFTKHINRKFTKYKHISEKWVQPLWNGSVRWNIHRTTDKIECKKVGGINPLDMCFYRLFCLVNFVKLNMKKTFINNNGDKIIIGTLLDVFLIETTELKYRIVEPLFWESTVNNIDNTLHN